jgi:hypothetical protein
MKISTIVLTAGLIAGTPVLSVAQNGADLNGQVTTMNNLTSNPGQTNVVGKISGDFNSFLGSDANAVVTGLRNGTPVTLTSMTTTPSPTPGGLPVTTTTTTVIAPPTGQMGFGNVYISLALAKQQLNTLGITQPAPEQLQAALTGGTITQTTGSGVTATTTTTDLPGVLTMRSQGMGWGQIAQKLGTKLGPVMSSMKSANKNFTGTATASSKGNSNSAASTQSGSSKTGIVSASGKPHGNSVHGVSTGKGSGEGIVSAAGKGNGNAYGLSNRSSIVTGSGSASGSNGGIVAAGGNGKGVANAKGHNK